MADSLVLAERVRNTIQLGESHFREFKSAFEGPPGAKEKRRWADVARDVAEALVAFANAEGGDLLVGVEDDGTITGVPHSPNEIRRILHAPEVNVHKRSRLPLQIAARLEIDGQTVLLFSVLKGTTGIYQLTDGRCMRRDGLSTVPESAERIMFERQESLSRSHDSEFVDAASVSDLDLGLVQDNADLYLRGITAEKYLQQLGLAEYMAGGLRLRRAALLLFARDIQRWHPRSQVRVLKVAGNQLGSGPDYNVVSDETMTGNVLQLLVSGWEQIRPFLAYKTEFGSDIRFEQKYLYPEGACREALVNAIVHRDYAIQNPIEVFIFDDRMEIKNPGALLSTLSIAQLERLEGAHESRNALIARALREGGYVRELGEGLRRMFSLMEASDRQKPKLATDETSFSVSLFMTSVFSEQERAWLGLFDNIQLTQLQQRIVVAGMSDRELSPQDIYASMNTTDRDTYDREVSGLRTQGLLVQTRTNSDAANMARRLSKAKAEIPRFKVVTPDAAVVPRRVEANVVADIPRGLSIAELRDAVSAFGSIAGLRVGRPTQAGVRRVYIRLTEDVDAAALIQRGSLTVGTAQVVLASR